MRSLGLTLAALSCLLLLAIPLGLRTHSPRAAPGAEVALPITGVTASAAHVAGVTLRPGTYPMTWNDTPRNTYYFSGGNLLSWTAARPALVKGEPPLPRGGARRYASLRFGEPPKTFVVILEESRKGRGIDALYADTDGDGDLAEESRLTRAAGRSWGTAARSPSEPRVTFGYPTPKGTRPITAEFTGLGSGRTGTQDVSYRLTGCWTGEIDTSRGKMRVALGDAAGEACFSKPGGNLWLDPSSVSHSSLYRYGGMQQPLGKAQLLFGELYRFTPSASGDSLKVAPYDGPIAVARVVATGGRGQKAKASFVSLSGAGSFEMEGDGELRVPPGDYTVEYARVECQSGASRADITVESSRPFTLAAGKPNEIRLGGPLRIALQGTRTSAPAPGAKARSNAQPLLLFPRGKATTVKVVLADAQGATAKPDSGAEKRKAFQGALLDPKGKEIAKAVFEYG